MLKNEGTSLLTAELFVFSKAEAISPLKLKKVYVNTGISSQPSFFDKMSRNRFIIDIFSSCIF